VVYIKEDSLFAFTSQKINDAHKNWCKQCSGSEKTLSKAPELLLKEDKNTLLGEDVKRSVE